MVGSGLLPLAVVAVVEITVVRGVVAEVVVGGREVVVAGGAVTRTDVSSITNTECKSGSNRHDSNEDTPINHTTIPHHFPWAGENKGLHLPKPLGQIERGN